MTDVILPAPRDPVPYDVWKAAIAQISAALRPHGLVLTVNMLDGSFAVESSETMPDSIIPT